MVGQHEEGVASSSSDVTALLQAWSDGDRGALDQLTPIVYHELRRPARFDARKVQVVEMRFFGGLSVEETGEALKVSPVTVMRDWNRAKAWLYRELSHGNADGSSALETTR
jgi:DNA-directed RNA polymerase specialized sigma subunit